MEISVRDLFEILMSNIDIKIIMTDTLIVDDELVCRYMLLYEGMKPLMEDDVLDEEEDFDARILDLDVILITNEIDKETDRIITVISVFPPHGRQRLID